MGYEGHMILFVMGHQEEYVREAHQKALDLFQVEGPSPSAECIAPVTPVMASPVNWYWSFCIMPSGSKMGCSPREEEAAKREEFKVYLAECPKQHKWLDWVEVVVHDDNKW